MVSQQRLVSLNNPNVRLYENDTQTKILIKSMFTTTQHGRRAILIPTVSHKTTMFDQNPYFSKAKKEGKDFIAFQSLSGRSVLISPITPYASIYTFAKLATPTEWRQLWKFVFHVRRELQKRFGGHFYISTIGTDVPQLHIRLERRPNVTYKIKFGPTVSKPDQSLIVKYANDIKGWTTRFKCSIEPSPNKSDVLVQFASPSWLLSTFGPGFEKLSVTELIDRTSTIYLNRHNWNRVPTNFTGSLSDYRLYLVQHELGHALFHIWDHDEEPKNGTCPVMMQQTKGTFTCSPGIDYHPHTWILPKSKAFNEWLYQL